MLRRLAVKLGAMLPLTLAVLLLRGPASNAQVATPAKSSAKTKIEARTKTKDDAKTPAPRKVLDLNSATADDLAELPGVGPATAKKIVDGRPYRSVADLSKVGVPERTIEKIKPMVTALPVALPSKPVDLNNADAATLASLPGVGPATAREIIAARPFKSVDDLERVKGLGKTKIDALKPHVKVSRPGVVPSPAPASTRTTPVETTPATPATTKPAPTPATPKGATTTAKTATPRTTTASGKKVNINTASKEELDALPGIGPVKSQLIIDDRPYKTIDDIKKVKGIKDVEFDKIKDVITVK